MTVEKIEASVITKIVFDSEGDFFDYLKTDSLSRITGFAKELKEAFYTGTPYEVSTPRPEIGAVTVSEIRIRKIRE